MPSNPVDEAREVYDEAVLACKRAEDSRFSYMGDTDRGRTRVDAYDAALNRCDEAWAAFEQAIREQERSRYEGLLTAAEARLQRIASVAVVRGRCVFCSHPDDPADGIHTSTCPVAPEPDPCPYVHDSGDRCVLQFEHGGSHDLGY